MDIGDEDKFEVEKMNEDSINHHSHNRPSNWQFSCTSFANNPLGLIPVGDPTEICNQDLIGSPWDHPLNSQKICFDKNVQNITSRCNSIGTGKVGDKALRTGHDRTLDIGWHQQSSILNRGPSLPNVHEMIPHSLSQFPTDSGFIERAAMFACFNGDSFSNMVNPVRIPQSTSPRHQKNELHMEELASKDGTLHAETEATEENVHKNERGETVLWSPDEAKECICVSNEADEAEFSGDGGIYGKPCEKEVGFKNRKRTGQETELHQVRSGKPHLVEAEKDYTEIQHGGQHSSPNTNTGKHGKQRSQASGLQKDEYTHIRARRGQATNSHSLAERVRRGKISEREKLLQELVPGCSKVKGKAVMLDEIIYYVQSLQRQVEFLSMKLATVDPRLDFNIEDLLTKDILQACAYPPSMSEFSPGVNMPYPQLHHAGAVNTDMGNCYDTFPETMTTQLKTLSEGYKGPSPMIPNAWEDELPNVVQMGLCPVFLRIPKI